MSGVIEIRLFFGRGFSFFFSLYSFGPHSHHHHPRMGEIGGGEIINDFPSPPHVTIDPSYSNLAIFVRSGLCGNLLCTVEKNKPRVELGESMTTTGKKMDTPHMGVQMSVTVWDRKKERTRQERNPCRTPCDANTPSGAHLARTPCLTRIFLISSCPKVIASRSIYFSLHPHAAIVYKAAVHRWS